MGKPGILKSLQMLAATLKSSEVESSTAHLAGGLVKWPHKCSNFLFRNQLQIKISRQKIYSLEYTQEGCQRYVWEWGVPMSASYNYWFFVFLKKDVFTWKQAWFLLSETVRRAIGEAWQQNTPFQGVHCPGNHVLFSCHFQPVEISRKMISLAVVLWSCPRGGHAGRVQAISIHTWALARAYLDTNAYCQLKGFLFASVSGCRPWEFS